MEFSLEQPVQGLVLSREGACLVNIPAPARYAIHKLVIYGERPVTERVKSIKDLEQAAALIEYFLTTHQPRQLRPPGRTRWAAVAGGSAARSKEDVRCSLAIRNWQPANSGRSVRWPRRAGASAAISPRASGQAGGSESRDVSPTVAALSGVRKDR